MPDKNTFFLAEAIINQSIKFIISVAHLLAAGLESWDGE